MLTRVAYPALPESTAFLGCGGASAVNHGELRLAPRCSAAHTSHVDTGEPLPVDMLQRSCWAKTDPSTRRSTRCGRSSWRASLLDCTASLLQSTPLVGARVAETLEECGGEGRRTPVGAFQPLTGELRAPIFCGLRRGLLQLQWSEVLAAERFEVTSQKPGCSTVHGERGSRFPSSHAVGRLAL